MNPTSLPSCHGLIATLIAITTVAAAAAPGVCAPPQSAEGSALPCAPAKEGEKLPMDFKDVPVRDIARLVGCALELNLVFSPPALGDRRVTVFAPRPVPAADLLRVLQSGLRDASLVLEKRGQYGVIREARSRVQRPSKRRSRSGRYPWIADLWR